MATESTRRVLLATALAGFAGSFGLAGCKGITALGQVPSIGPDVIMLKHAIEAEEAMVATYRSAAGSIAGAGAGAGAGADAGTAGSVIAAIQAEHQAHLARLRARLILPPKDAKTKLHPVPRVPPQLPSDERELLRALADAERAAAARLTDQLVSVPSALAQLMASISASEAAHVVFLRKARSA